MRSYEIRALLGQPVGGKALWTVGTCATLDKAIALAESMEWVHIHPPSGCLRLYPASNVQYFDVVEVISNDRHAKESPPQGAPKTAKEDKRVNAGDVSPARGSVQVSSDATPRAGRRKNAKASRKDGADS